MWRKGRNLARRRKPRIYDEEIYTNFGEQPYPFEIQIGYSLIPLEDKNRESNLQREITYCRNQIDAEYGLPVPTVHIRDNMCLDPYEYSILFNGVEVGKSSVRLGYQLCMDTGSVTTQLDSSFCDKTKDPAFWLDAFYVSDEDVGKYKAAGYVCVPPEKVIGTHLCEIIRKYRTRVLNQNLVNTLVEKVRKQNPDVISDVFFYHQFPMSSMKLLLNHLLEEEISIRDMNTILLTKVAEMNGISCVENKPLARTLYYKLKEGDLIPSKYVNAVATVYSNLDKFKNKKEESEFYEQLNNDALAKIYSLEKTVYRQVERKYFKEQKVCESLYEGEVVKYFTEEFRILAEDNELNYRTFHNAAYKSDEFYLETYFEK